MVAGEHSHSVHEDSEQVMQVKDIIIHPQYNAIIFENDIAVIKLTKHLQFNKYVQPIRLPPEGVTTTGECMLAGWGPSKEYGEAADVPYKITVRVWSHEECTKTLAGRFNVAEHMMCAGYQEGGVGACESDSGSPLTCYDDSEPYMAGLVSWQYGCARPSYPAIYTNLVYFTHWLKELRINTTQTITTKGNQHC